MTTTPSSPSTGYPRIRWLTFCLVFFALPQILVCYWFGRLWEDRTEARLSRSFREMEATLDAVTRWRHTESFLESVLDRLGKSFSRWPESKKLVRRQLASIRKRFPETLEFVFLDANGQIIKPLSDLEPPKAVLRKFWGDFQKYCRGESLPMKTSWNIYRNIFGPLVRPTDLKRLEFQQAFIEKHHSQVLFSNVSPAGMFFVFANQTPAWKSLAVIDEVSRHNRRPDVHPVAFVDIGDWSLLSRIPSSFDEGELRNLILQFDRTPGKFLEYHGRWWFQKALNTTTRLFTFFPIAEDAGIKRERFGVVGVLTLFFALLSWISLRVMIGNAVFFFSLRYKLLLLFLYIVGLPLMIMGITAGGYLAELRVRLENKVFADTEEALRNHDQNLPVILGLLDNTIRNKVFAPVKPEKQHLATILSRMTRFFKKYQLGKAGLFDNAGNVIYPEGVEMDKDDKNMKIIKPVYIGLLKSMQSKGRTEFDDIKGTGAVQMVTAVAGIDLEQFFADAAKSTGELRTIEYGGRKIVQGLYPVLDTTGFPSYLALFHWNHIHMQFIYNERYLLRLEKKLPETSLVAIPQETVKRRDRISKRVFPQSFRFFDLAIPLYPTFSSSGRNLHLIRKFRGTTYFINLFRGQELYEYYLVGVTSDRLINEEISRVKGNFRMVSLGLLLMAFTVANLVARKFLEPVGNLTAGVMAIKEKDFDKRIPIIDTDELGELSTTFNQMIESLHEVSLGQQVQEQLFPAKKLVLGEYQVRGVSRTATGLGGDYFEYISIGDRYLLVLLGDATGHGIPAALVMAMAKAVVLQCSQQPNIDGKQVMETLNRIIFLGMARKRLMTAACLWIDTQTHAIEFWNGGHPFPIRQFNNGTFVMIEASGAPLGIRTKIVLTPGKTSLEAGERIFLYTDGLIESIPEIPEKTNFDLFMEYLGTRPILPIEQACEDILDNHVHTLTGQPLPDDFTIVILERTAVSTNG